MALKENPVLGYGIFSFQTSMPELFVNQPNQAHNEFLNIWFSYGLFGIVLALSCYLLLFKKTRFLLKRKEDNAGSISFLFLIYFFVRGLTEGHPYGMVFIMPLFILCFEWINNDVHKAKLENTKVVSYKPKAS